MILPTASNPQEQASERAKFYRNTIRECEVSRSRRQAQERRLQAYYLRGSDLDQPVRRNKLDEWVDSSASNCYAPEGARFGVVYPPSHGDRWLEELDVAREEIQRLFIDSGADQAYGIMVEWAHVYPSMFGKVLVSDDGVMLDVVPNPSDLGAWNESLGSLDQQEAFVHWFDMDVGSFERMVRQAVRDKTLADTIVGEGLESRTRGSDRSGLAAAVPAPVLIAAVSPTMQGAIQALNLPIAEPDVQAEVVSLAELWIRDDLAVPICTCGKRQGDLRHEQGPLYDHAFKSSGKHEWEWRKVLHMPSSERVLWSSLNPLLPQRQPIRQLCLKPWRNYLWGVSPMEKLIQMQAWGEALIGKHDLLLDLQLDPPIAIKGISSVDGERSKLLRKPGGTFTMPFQPGAEIQRLAPETPPDAPGMTKLIDDWFNQAGGLPYGSQGPSDPNVRSAGQVTAGAVLSSPRTNRRAMRVEDALEEILTDMLRLQRRISKDPLEIPLPKPDPETGEKSRKVYLSQMPGDFSVRVSAHSASPLYQQQAKTDAIVLHKEGLISPEMAVKMYGPALEDLVVADARRLQAAKAERAEKLVAIKEAEAQAKIEKAQKK